MKKASLIKAEDFGLPPGTVHINHPKEKDVERVAAGDCAILAVRVRDGDDWSPWLEFCAAKTNPWFSLQEAWELAGYINGHPSEYDEVEVRVMQLRSVEKPNE